MSSHATLTSLLQWVIRGMPNHVRNILLGLRHIPLVYTAFGGLLAWVQVTQMFRWKRYYAIHREYGHRYNNGKGTITPEEAQKIMHVSSMYDMPMLLNYSVAFALFKTYGIPSISEILAATKQLGSEETISRRYADTEILISTWVNCPISGFLDPSAALKNRGTDAEPAEDPRAMIALARVNWLHSRYEIANDDYLYALCLFVLEPAVWADRYGWRSLSPLEKHAFYVFWVEIGGRMGIKDIPGTLEDMMDWSKQYERANMVPAEINKEVSGCTVNELLTAVPNALGLKTFAQRITICLMDDIVREAMLQPKQPWILHALVNSLLGTAAFVQRWLLLPRSLPRSAVDLRPPKVDANLGCLRFYPTKWTARPWYRKESTGLGYVRDRFLVAIGWFSEMPGPHLKSGGYRYEEMGPFQFENSAREEIMKQAAVLQGCPVAGPWITGSGVANQCSYGR